MNKDYYLMKTEDALTELKTSKEGLTPDEAKKRLAEQGYNELQKEGGTKAIIIYLNQFKNFLILLLIFATVVSFFLGEFIDAIAMMVIVLLSTSLGFFQEYRAEKAIEALKRISAPTVRVIREGKVTRIPVREIVIGDILSLEAGDIIAADSRIIESKSLQIDEASLTGESVPSDKITTPYKSKIQIDEQENMAFMGTVVTYGKGKAVVTSTGMKTELGKIAESIQETTETQTPLQVKFNNMAKQMGIAVILLVVIVFIAGLIKEHNSGGINPSSFKLLFIFSLSLAVAAVPSSLPAIVTISLGLGAKMLAKKNMIIKRLPAAESLGSVTIICSDKTGTMTKNQMTVTKIYTDNQIIDVTGDGYNPQGNFLKEGREVGIKGIELPIKIGYMCNSAKLYDEDGLWNIIGDPTEGALIVLGDKAKINDSIQNIEKIEELPFDSERKRMTVIVKNIETKKVEAYVKGAPDLLLNICNKVLINGKAIKITEKEKKTISDANEKFAESALRVLGFAYRELEESKKYSISNVENDLIFVGLVGMIDPPRDGVKEAVEICRNANIKVMMITGDHSLTAKAVAKEIGLFKEGDELLTGEELDKLSDEELKKIIDNVRIVARTLPIQKSRIVTALKENGHVVAMTGDGVNDAPALKKADIGIAMGITGTDVAKEVSKAILVDDNFSTIVHAVEEGRNIYDKIIKSTRYLLSCNVGEVITVFISIMIGMPLPLVPLQILMMNLVTDGLPALALGTESSEGNVMSRSPRSPKENPISKHMLALIMVFGLVMGAGTVYIFGYYYNGKESNLSVARTAAFTALVMFEMFAVIGSRSLYALKKLNPFSNIWVLLGILSSVLLQIAVVYWKPLQSVFSTTPLSLYQWTMIIMVSGIGFVAMELCKFFISRNPAKT